MRQRLAVRAYAEGLVTLLNELPEERTPDILRAFVRFLARERVLHRGEHILSEVERLLIEEEGFLRADVSLAEPQGEEHVVTIERLLGTLVGQPVRALIATDPRLVAGFRAQVEDLVVDASLRGALARLKGELS